MIFVSVAIPFSLCAKTWYVSNSGNDNYSGNKNQPFKTLSKGAEMAQAGDTVFVLAGVYRERVSPPRGGVAGKPIVYLGEPGKQVFIKGSDVYVKPWKRVHAESNIFSADLNQMQFTDDCYWDNANPFKVASSAAPYFRDNDFITASEGYKSKDRDYTPNIPGRGYTLGQVFVAGEPYLQAPLVSEMEKQPGSWWYEPGSNKVLVNFRQGHSTANEVEITTRRRIFAPHIKGLGYIQVIGFIMEHCGNQFPLDFWAVKEFAQAGALGLRCGHHWLVKNNVVRYAANVGIDCGAMGQIGERDDKEGLDAPNVIDNIIEYNYVVDNGSNGIMGAGSTNMIVRGNVVMYNNNLLYNYGLYEQAGLKFHNCINAVISENYVAKNYKTYGIWLDNRFPHSRVTRNIIVENGRAGIFCEMSDYPFGSVLIDHNIIMNNIENPIYQHDSSGALYVNNLIAGASPCDFIELPVLQGQGISWRSDRYEQAVLIRQMTERTRSDKNAFYNNLFCNNHTIYEILYPIAKGGEQRFLGNLYGGSTEDRLMRINNWSDTPSPFDEATFKERVAADLGTDINGIVYEAGVVRMKLSEWQTFWSKHSKHYDKDAAMMPGLSAEYLPATQSVRLTVPEAVAKRANAQWNKDYKAIYGLTEKQSYPGPFDNLRTGTYDYKLFQGLPVLESGQLPDFIQFTGKK
ncbi:hypothetical protein FACS1894160_4110 [Bacteroidia bacterium]|nr:hypothetical protein FACS1894123_00100 [Bacteroidia bacterium]GHV08962.1 hypothetical protein FACS1894160_4110 [Bacteroidia bacterium]